MTYEKLLLSCLKIGLSLKDVDAMEIGMLIDLITTSNNLFYEVEKENVVRKATQKDFDSF